MRRIIPLLLYVFVGFSFSQDNYTAERTQMVNKQLKADGITDAATLQAMRTVPRHEFVPQRLKKHAYTDGPLPIGNDQTISQPYIVAYMTQALQLKPSDRVLEIGTGSGYQAAVLAEMVDTVHTIEIVKDLALSAKERLNQLGYDNVVVTWGDGYHGLPDKAPFDAIMVTAGAKDIPQPLIDQLGEGGRMIIPVGAHHANSRLVLATKKNNKITTKYMIPVRFVPFTRAQKKN